MTTFTEPNPFCQKKFKNKNFYDHKARWIHYFHQIRRVASVLRNYPEGKEFSVLEIGPSHGVVTHYLQLCGVPVKTLDVDPDNKPDYRGSVTNINTLVPSNSCDMIIACEILEHLPFADFASILEKMKKVSRKYIFISVPDSRRILFQARLKLPALNEVSCSFRITGPRMEPQPNGGHQWELGRRGTSRSRVLKEIKKAGLRIEAHYSNIDTPQNYYFLLSK